MKSRLTDLCLMAMMGTVMVVSKEALAFLPNVELVSLWIILFTVVFQRRVLSGYVPVHLAAFGLGCLALPMDETLLAMGDFVRTLWVGLWHTVLPGLFAHRRRLHGHRMDYQRAAL